MSERLSRRFGVLACVVGALAGACSSDPTTTTGRAGNLTIVPVQAYSGFDGSHTYQVPIAVHGGGTDVNLTADKSEASIVKTALVDPEGDTGVYFMVTVKVGGQINLTATSGGNGVTSKIIAVDYPPTDYAVGETRYMNGTSKDPPCIECHTLPGGIDHSPTVMAPLTDAQVLGTIVTGVLPSGMPIMTTMHTWTVTDAEKAGLLTYLRALPPNGFTK